ncbi:MAG: hypothetical protein R3C53_22895 [Pirellulaceae bacterium]
MMAAYDGLHQARRSSQRCAHDVGGLIFRALLPAAMPVRQLVADSVGFDLRGSAVEGALGEEPAVDAGFDLPKKAVELGEAV